MQLSEIYIYPIKSLGGISLETTQLEVRGLQNDRRFMLTNLDGLFLSQRTFRQMALLKTAIEGDKILVWHQDNPANILSIPTNPTDYLKEQEVEVWGTTSIGQVMQPFYNQWFQEQLKTDCQLVYMPTTAKRRMKAKYSIHNDLVSFADGAPILVAGQSGLDDLNDRLDNPVSMNRFRPNLVYTGGKAFEEDDWKAIQIGTQQFRITHRCVRCNVPNINQENGQIEKEPNKTLATFRRFNRAIYFGVNAVWESALSQGKSLKVGAELKIL